jgi:formate C-acetyltransferase
LSRDIAPQNVQGQTILKQLLATAVDMGVGVMSTAIYDVDTMQDAKIHPERHEDLIVRVWGYSARFVDLAGDMQDHVIARVLSE